MFFARASFGWLPGSPSTRRVWIEMAAVWSAGGVRDVTLHTEGVDRNCELMPSRNIRYVTLHTEGVDRNSRPFRLSPPLPVTLHTEGVDRNWGVCRGHG